MTDEPIASPTPADPFRDMAERIERNDAAEFGGAFVLVPPGLASDMKPVEMLILDPNADAAQFWGTLMTRAKIALDEIEQAQRGAGVYGRR